MWSNFWRLIRKTADQWISDKAVLHGAALAFYGVLSAAPLAVIAVAIGGYVFGPEAARGEVVSQIEGFVGREAAEAVQQMLARDHQRSGGIAATALGIAMLLIAASGVFVQLQDSLNTVWNVKVKPGSSLRELLKTRAISFAMVLGAGLLLLVLVAISAGLSTFEASIHGTMPARNLALRAASFVASLAVITLLFALLFRVLPDVEIAWKDVWVGAGITAVLFTIGKFLIGLYLTHAGIGSSYGAAGSLVALVLWIYYSSLILFFGAEFTQVYAQETGSPIRPAPHAEPLSPESRFQKANSAPSPDAAP